MLGSHLDYLILRSLAHRRHMASEKELDAAFVQAPAPSADEATPKLKKLIERFDGHFPLTPGLRYLDMGCGTGELSVAIARLSGGHVTGVDFMPRGIERARAYAASIGATPNVDFVCADIHRWQPTEKFNVVLSFDAFEHIDNPRACLGRMADFVAPGGVAVLAFGPLFHSPFGDHMWDFFRVQIPWRGLLFGERALLRVRREFFRPTDPAKRYQEIAGGLNLLRYSEFLRDVEATGWTFDYLAVNTFLRGRPVLRAISDFLMRIGPLRDYLAHNVYAVLRRRSNA